MNRRSFLAAAGGAVAAAALPAATTGEWITIPNVTGITLPPKMTVRLTVDSREFQSALNRISEIMSTFPEPPTREELNAQMEGMPPIVLRMDGKECGRLYLDKFLFAEQHDVLDRHS